MYGCDWYFQSKEFLDKQKEFTNNQSDKNWKQIMEKICDTIYKKTGIKVTNPSQLPQVKKKVAQNRKNKRTFSTNYKYNNIIFDSSYELCYYIWLRDNGIDFEYQPPNCTFDYEYEGETHTYFPDFKIGDRIVEIKGLHFFKNKDINEVMINPYNRSQDGLAEAKHQCMIKNGIELLTECGKYIKYVKNKYGKNFIKELKVNR